MTRPLVTAEEVADRLGDDSVVILDVRWQLGGPPGRRAYLAGHIPGARFVDLETDLTGPPHPGAGRHPLPARTDLAAAARRWGVRPGCTVVCYDDRTGPGATRAWWLLHGAPDVEVLVLDGGFSAWTAAGLPVETGPVPDPDPGPLPDAGPGLPVVDADAVARWTGPLIDVRAPERYRGEEEPVDPVAGHIPGAVNVPAGRLTGPDGRMLDPDRLRALFAAAGVDDRTARVAVYCGSGITATQGVLALHLLRVPAVLYPGSWSGWICDPARPIATDLPRSTT